MLATLTWWLDYEIKKCWSKQLCRGHMFSARYHTHISRCSSYVLRRRLLDIPPSDVLASRFHWYPDVFRLRAAPQWRQILLHAVNAAFHKSASMSTVRMCSCSPWFWFRKCQRFPFWKRIPWNIRTVLLLPACLALTQQRQQSYYSRYKMSEKMCC